MRESELDLLLYYFGTRIIILLSQAMLTMCLSARLQGDLWMDRLKKIKQLEVEFRGMPWAERILRKARKELEARPSKKALPPKGAGVAFSTT